MKRLIFFLIPFLFCTLQAQDLKLLKGDFEVEGRAAFDQRELAGEFRFGAFVRDYVQIGIDLTYSDTDRLNRFSLGTYFLWMFETNTYFLPYAGSGLSLSSLDVDGGVSDSGLDFFLFAGLKYYVADNVSLNTEVKVSYSTAETFFDDDEVTNSDYGLRIGLSYYW